jgi:hypothetical protein
MELLSATSIAASTPARASASAWDRILRWLFRRSGLDPSLQHRSHPANPSHPPESEGFSP